MFSSKKEKKKKKKKDEGEKAEGEGEEGRTPGGPVTPERLKEIVDAINAEGALQYRTSDEQNEDKPRHEQRPLKDPTDYAGFVYSPYWDNKEDEDPANQIEIHSVYDDVRSTILKAEGHSAGPHPAWSQPQAKVIVLMVTEDGYLEEQPIAPTIPCLDKNSASSVITQFSSLPLEQVHHFAYNGEYMNALFKDRKLVDILVHIEDRTFCGHRCILCAHSGYFSSVLVDSSVPPYAITDVTLKSIDPDHFKKFLNFAYSGEIFLTLSNVEAFRKLANKMKSKTLRAKIAVFLSKSKTLTLDEALQILLNNLGDEEFLRPLAMETVVKNFKQLLLDPIKLCHFSKEDLLYILQADNLSVDSELDTFWSVLFWVAVDPVGRAPAMNRLMSAVRFTTMSSLELMDCARVSDLVRLSTRCKVYLINANWVCHTREVGLEDPLGLVKEQKRSSLIHSKPHEPTVAEFDMRFLIYNALLNDSQGHIVQPPPGKETEGKLHDYISSIQLPSRGSLLSKKSVKFAADEDEKTSKKDKKEKKDKKSGKKDKKDKKESKDKKGKKDKKSKKGEKGSDADDASENHNISGNYDEESDLDISSASESEAQNTSKNKTAIFDIDLSTASPENNNKTSSLVAFSDSSIIFDDGSRDDVDALQLWEKSASSSAELLLLGGDILQPRRSFTVSLTRSRPNTEAEVGLSASSRSWPVPTSMEVTGASHPRSLLELTQSDGVTGSRGNTLPLAGRDNFDGDEVLSTADTSDQVTFPEFSEENQRENFNYGGHDGESRENTYDRVTTRSTRAKKLNEPQENFNHRRHRGKSRSDASRDISSSTHRSFRASTGSATRGQVTDRQADREVTTRIHNTSSLDDQPTFSGNSDDLIHL